MIKLTIILLIGLLVAVSYADATLGSVEALKLKLKHRYPVLRRGGAAGGANYASAAGSASAYGGSAAAAASASASAGTSGYGTRSSRPVVSQGFGDRANYGDYEDQYGYNQRDELPPRPRYAGYGQDYEGAGASAAASASAATYAAPPVPEAPAAPSINLDTFKRNNVALAYRPAVRYGARPAGYGASAAASSAVAGGSRAGFGGAAASAAASAGVRGPAVQSVRPVPFVRGSGAGSAASAAAAASAGSGFVRARPAVVSDQFEDDQSASSSVSAGAGTYSNDDNGRESSSYKRSTENVQNHEDGRADDDHYYNAQSYGKADDENLHEAFNKNNEDIEQSPNVYRSKKNAENYVLDYNKARRESGSGVLAKDKHSSAYNKNSKRFVENVDQKHNREGNGILEDVNRVSSQNFDDEDEEIYDSEGFSPERSYVAGNRAAATSAAAAAAGSVATSASAASAH